MQVTTVYSKMLQYHLTIFYHFSSHHETTQFSYHLLQVTLFSPTRCSATWKAKVNRRPCNKKHSQVLWIFLWPSKWSTYKSFKYFHSFKMSLHYYTHSYYAFQRLWWYLRRIKRYEITLKWNFYIEGFHFLTPAIIFITFILYTHNTASIALSSFYLIILA